MKIEVTFDKTTKREFRDQCIKRLQNFVSQIHGNKQNSNTKRNNHTSTEEEKCQELRIKVQSAILGQKEKKIGRGDEKYGKSFKKQSEIFSMNNNCVTDKKYKTPQESRIQRREEESTVNSECESPRSSFNLTEMRDKVNKILQKFEKTEKIRSKNQKSIEEQLSNTNRKLDYLIECIERGNVVATSRLCSQNQSSREVVSTSFQEKFDKLARRYHDIKEKGMRSTTNRMSTFQKTLDSLSATQDSLTFRRN